VSHVEVTVILPLIITAKLTTFTNVQYKPSLFCVTLLGTVVIKGYVPRTLTLNRVMIKVNQPQYRPGQAMSVPVV